MTAQCVRAVTRYYYLNINDLIMISLQYFLGFI